MDFDVPKCHLAKDPNHTYYIYMTELHIPLRKILLRGLRGSCPNCNQAPLFRAYLKAVPTCSNCGVRWENIRAELGPSWASMALAAHIIVPFYHIILFKSAVPIWQQMTLLIAMAIGLCLYLLPRMKGLFMAIIWAKDTSDS